MEYLASLVLSIAALAVSAFLAYKHNRLTESGNHLPLVLSDFKTSRRPEWLPAQEYILGKLASEHPVGRSWRDLPPDARAHVDTVGIFYDDLGKQVAHGWIDQDVVIGSYGMPIVYLWDTLAPYVYEERRAHMPNFWVYFEDLAVRAAERPPDMVYRKLGLRSRPPRHGAVAPGSAEQLTGTSRHSGNTQRSGQG
ncbi:MAG: hypothetical protein J2P25_18415 [Nocardiopsaceae bacterium]|nr:hypothetical protein [Nocardiopsaceae bacterium]